MKEITSSHCVRVSVAFFRGVIPACMALMAGTVANAQSPYANAVMTLGPAAYWPLQETAQPPATYEEPNVATYPGGPGALANIYFASTANANISVGSTYPANGVQGSGTWFRGNSSGFGIVPTTTNSVSLAPGQPFSVETWCQPQETGSYQGIFNNSGTIPNGGNNNANYKAGWCFNQNYTPNEDDGSGTQSGALFGWSFAVFNGTSKYGGAQAVAAYQYNTTSWYHLVGVFDGTNANIYVNGVLATTQSTPMPADTAFIPDTWDPIQFGCSRGIDANSWTGVLDDVAIYNYALTPTQVANHYAAANSYYEGAVFGDNPYMFWYMNGNAANFPGPVTQPTPTSSTSWPTAANYGSQAGSVINYDYSGIFGADAVYQPGTVPGVPGPQFAGFGGTSYACAFNGINSVVDAGYASALNPTTTSNFSVVGWFKDNPSDNNNRTNTLVSHTGKSWRVCIINGATKFNPGLGAASDVTGPNLNVNDGNWHMFAAVWTNTSGNNGTASLYIDGAFSNSASLTTAFTGVTATNIFLGGAPDYAQVNYSAYNANYNTNYNTAQQYYAGELAHVAYFASALTSAQIETLYSAAEAPPNIVTQPASVAGVINGGGTNTFTVTASGAATLTYQWWMISNGVPVQLNNDTVHISGATSPTLTITNTIGSESGSYYVVVGNSYGSATSSSATLQISSAPAITSQVGGGALQLFVGQYYTLSVTAVGDPTLTYQWYTNGVADTTAGTTSAYALNAVQPSQTGTTYQCIVSNSIGAATSATTTLTVTNLPASLTSSPYSAAILALSPAAYWPMHEVSPGVPGDTETNLGTLGSVANGAYADWDIIVNTNTANYNSNTAEADDFVQIDHGQAGAIVNDPDTSVGFNRGQASYMIVPHTSPNATIRAPFTVECWAKPVINANYAVLVGQGGGSGLNTNANLGGFDLQWGGPTVTNSFSFTIFNGNGSGSSTISTPANYPVGQWYHVVATYDGTNLSIYVNGQTPVGGYANGSVLTGTMNPDYWTPLSIGVGRITTSAPAPDPYSGLIDEVAIYSNILSPSVIAQHYSDALNGANGVYKSDVLAQHPPLYFRMDAPAYTQPPMASWPVLTNYGSNAINGVYTPGSLPGSYNGASLITGLSSGVASPGNGMGAFAIAGLYPSIDPLGYTSFSYSGFFRGYPADSREGNWQSVMSGNDGTWRASIETGNGQFVGHGAADAATPTSYNDGNWHHFVVTAQGNPTVGNFTNLVYVDGVVVVTNIASATNNPASKPGPLILLGNEYGFQLTNSTGNPASERCLSGVVCEAAFFNGVILTSNQVTNLYYQAGVAPFFTLQPVSTNINQGLNFTNKVAVNGSGSTFNVQWYNNGVALAGQTNLTLVFNPVTSVNASSDYYCVVSNSFGVGTSMASSISVNTSPVFTSTSPGANLTVLAGITIPFSVTMSGATPLTYSWLSNGVVVAGATNSTLNLTTSASSGGTYASVVTNSLGKATNYWTVTIVPTSGPFMAAAVALGPADYWMLNEPNGSTVCHDYVGGNNGSYENTTLGVPGYGVFDDTSSFYDTNTAAEFFPPNSCAYNISNINVTLSKLVSTNATFTVQAWVQASNTIPTSLNAPGIASVGAWGNEQFTLDDGNHLTTDAYRFTVRSAANTIYTANSSLMSGADTNWHLLVGVCDEVHSNIYFYVDGKLASSTAIPAGAGITPFNSAFPMTIGSRSSAGVYSPASMDQQFNGNVADVALFNFAMTSNQVSSEYLAVGIAPTINPEPPQNTNVTAGNTLTVPASVYGTTPLSYQWYDTNGIVPGQTNSSLVVSNDITSDTYYFVVTNLYGSAISSNVVVAVNRVPVITSALPQSNLIVLPGANIAFSVTVTGDNPLYYSWYRNGALIAGQTNLSFTVTNISASGTYTFGVSNSLATNSTAWNVTVQPASGGFIPAVMALQPAGYWLLNEPPGSTICIDYAGGNDGLYENTTLGQPGYAASDSSTSSHDTNTSAGFLAPENSCAYNISNIDISVPVNSNATFTVQAWVQCPNEISDSINAPGIVAEGIWSSEPFTLDVGAHIGTTDGYRFTVRTAADAIYSAPSTLVAGSDSNWHFLVGVCDEAHGIISLYIDGTNASTSAIPPGSGIEAFNSAAPLTIGSRSSAATYTISDMNQQFTGDIADVAVFKYALSSNQVLSEYLAAGIPPNIQPLPATLGADYGSPLTIAATVLGTAPITYTWMDVNTGLPVPGQTNATLVINNDTANDSYYLVAGNAYGTNTSSPVAVTVYKAMDIIQDITPSTAAIVADTALSLSVLVDGQAPITYVWMRNGQTVANSPRISGATSNVLTINPTLVSDAGTYQLFVTNPDGSTNSSQAVVAISPNLTFNSTGAGWTSQSSSSSLAWEGNNVLQLTEDLGSEDSSSFYAYPVNIGSFQASFAYQVPTGPTTSADGMTFCIQNDPRGAAALGAGGGALGVGASPAISPSVEMEFNIYAGNGVGGVGLAFGTNGAVSTAQSTAPVVLNSGDVINVAVTYENNVAMVTLTDGTATTQFTTLTNINIPAVLGTNLAYVGFTGSDGSDKSTQIVSDFSFVNIVSLAAQVSGTNLVLTWPAGTGGYVLEQSSSLSSPAWNVVAQTPTIVNNQNQVVVPEPVSPQFYQLKLANADQ